MATRCQVQAGPGAGTLQQLWSSSQCLARQGNFQESPHQLTVSLQPAVLVSQKTPRRLKSEWEFMSIPLCVTLCEVQHPLHGHNILSRATTFSCGMFPHPHQGCGAADLGWDSSLNLSKGTGLRKGISSPQRGCLVLLLSQRVLCHSAPSPCLKKSPLRYVFWTGAGIWFRSSSEL